MNSDHGKYALIKNNQSPTKYDVVEINERLFRLFDDKREAFEMTRKLLADGADIFESIAAFYAKYPSLSAEERKRRGVEALEKFMRDKL